MALFEISMQEEKDIGCWVNEMHIEIKGKAEKMCDEYNFNFFEGLPYKSTKKFEWVPCELENWEERDFSTRPSRNTFANENEEILEIHDLDIDIPELLIDVKIPIANNLKKECDRSMVMAGKLLKIIKRRVFGEIVQEARFSMRLMSEKNKIYK